MFLIFLKMIFMSRALFLIILYIYVIIFKIVLKK